MSKEAAEEFPPTTAESSFRYRRRRHRRRRATSLRNVKAKLVSSKVPEQDREKERERERRGSKKVPRTSFPSRFAVSSSQQYEAARLLALAGFSVQVSRE